MRHDLDAALDQCLTWMREGMDLKSCLDRFPEHAVQLRPLLEVAVDVVRVRVPASPLEARAAGQQRMLAAIAKKQERRAQAIPAVLFLKQVFWSILPGRPGSLRPAWQLAAVVLTVLLFASGWLTVSASASSLPGDALYFVKLASQRAQLALMFNPARQQLMADQFETQRRLDVQAVLKGQRQVVVEFQGVLQQFDSSLWVVGGLQVAVQETTTISGKPNLGARVQVQAALPGDGRLVATGLRVESTAGPESSDDGQPTATQGATDTPEPTETPKPTATPESTATLEATGTPTPSETPETVETLEPDETAEPEETTEPEESPEPDDTAEHEEESDETGTPDPDDSDEVDEGDEFDEGDEGDETPDPTDTSDSDHSDTRRPTPRPTNTETPEPDDPDEHDGTPDPTEMPDLDDPDEHDGTLASTATPDPDSPDEHDGTPDPTGTPDSDDPDEHDGTPNPTETPDD